MGQVSVVTDTKDPNWGMPPSADSVVSDTKDPNWGMPTQTEFKPSDSGALGLRATASAIPAVGKAAAEFATNPNVAKTGAAIGRVVGGVAPVVGGLVEGGPVGSLVGVAAASRGAWAGGKTGWFTGKMLQSLSTPVANAMDTLAPYAQAISTVSGAQGVLDLAQMADKTRKDIGFLGIGHTLTPEELAQGNTNAEASHQRAATEQQSKDQAWASAAAKISDLASALKTNGVPAAEAMAMKLISAGNAATFGKLMTIYMRAKSSR